jgi:hypothetical protein
MANASKKSFGKATQGKRAGVGGMTNIRKEGIEENKVLSNRDKSQHSRDRGLDGKETKTEQYQDHAGGHLRDE